MSAVVKSNAVRPALRPSKRSLRSLARSNSPRRVGDEGVVRYATVTAVDAPSRTVTVDIGASVDGVPCARSYSDATVNDIVVLAVINGELVALAAL